jgi:hypothetical protein
MIAAYRRGLDSLSPPAPVRRNPPTVIGGPFTDRVLAEAAPIVAGAAIREIVGRPRLLAAAAVGGMAYGAWRMWQVPSLRNAIGHATAALGRLMK